MKDCAQGTVSRRMVKYRVVSLLAVFVQLGFAAAPTELPPAADKVPYSVQLHFQGTSPITVKVVTGKGDTDLAGWGLTVDPDKGTISGTPNIPEDKAFTFTLRVQDSSQPPQDFQVEYHLQGHHTSASVSVPALVAGDVGGNCEGDDEKYYSDCRGVFNASFYLGLAVDTFAGSDTLKYLNPGATGQIHERGIGGFDFSYRLMGDKTPMVGESYQHRSLWIYGETVHGVRSADVNCTNNPDLPVCQKALGGVANPGPGLYYILRNATSLEGYMGLRYEFWNLNRDSDSPANLYFKAQAGFLSLAGAPGSALDMHDLAVGAVATKGRFQDSYLEVGWGRSDTFATARRKRVKIDGYLEWKIPGSIGDKGFSAFAQLFVDTDVGRGSDAIQSYIGVNYDLDKLFK